MVLKKSIVLFFSFFCLSLTTNHAYAQKQLLEITNLKNNRTKKIKERKRITVFTKDSKIRGALKILDNETILIKGIEVKISNITMIKSKSIFGKIFGYVLIPAFTLSTLGILAITGASSSVVNAVGLTGLSLVITSVITRRKFNSEHYKFKIVYD